MPFNKQKKNGITTRGLMPTLLNVRRSLSLKSAIASRTPKAIDRIADIDETIKRSKASIMSFISAILENVTRNIRQQFRGYKVQTVADLDVTDFPAFVVTKIPFESIVYSDVNYNTTNYEFTAPRAGFYTFRCQFIAVESIVAEERLYRAFGIPQLNVYVNDSKYENLDWSYQQIDFLYLNGSRLIYLNCGDIADVRLYYEHDAAEVYDLTDVKCILDINYEGCNGAPGDIIHPFPTISWTYNADIQ